MNESNPSRKPAPSITGIPKSAEPAYTPVPPRGTMPQGRLRETLEVVEQGWTRRMIRANHPVYSSRIGWKRNWCEPGVAGDGNALGMYVLRGLGKLAWLLPESDAARYFRGVALPRLISSQDPDGYLGARDAGDYHYPCWELLAASDVLEALLFEHCVSGDPAAAEAAQRFSTFLVTDGAYMGGEGYPSMPSTVKGTRWDHPYALFRGMLQSTYRLTGNVQVLDRLLYCFERIRKGGRDFLQQAGTSGDGHLVDISHDIQMSAVMSLLTRDPVDLATAICGAERVMTVAGQVSGYPMAWEGYEAADPRKTTEHCNFIEWPSACRTLFDLAGEVRYADWAERALYNGYWGSKTKNGVALQYQSAPNQLVLAPWMRTKRDGDPYGSDHGWFDMQHCPGCCNSFTAEAFPRHIEHAVVRGRDGALAVVYYMPCGFGVPLENGSRLTLEMNTDYPFEDAVRIELQLTEPAYFPLELRIPGWARGATVTVNGSLMDVPVCSGTMYRIERDWQSGDVVEVMFDFPVQLAWHHEADCVPGVAVQRGPLVYSLPVEAQWEYTGAGRPGTDNINIDERWHLFPREDARWNMALDLDPADPERACEVVHLPTPAGTTAWQAAPVGLSVRGYRVPGWKLAGTPDQPMTPPMPERETFAVAPQVLDLILIPMGCTELRMTCLPLAKSPCLRGPIGQLDR